MVRNWWVDYGGQEGPFQSADLDFLLHFVYSHTQTAAFYTAIRMAFLSVTDKSSDSIPTLHYYLPRSYVYLRRSASHCYYLQELTVSPHSILVNLFLFLPGGHVRAPLMAFLSVTDIPERYRHSWALQTKPRFEPCTPHDYLPRFPLRKYTD